MGRHYAQQLRDLVAEAGGPGLLVFVNEAGLHPHYYVHVVEVLRECKCTLVDARTAAQVIVEGYTRPDEIAPGRIYLVLEDGRLVALQGPALQSVSRG
jgi:hypothetical protein